MADADDGDVPMQGDQPFTSAKDVSMPDAETVKKKRKASKTNKGHEISTLTIKHPPFSYACLELISDPPSKASLDDLTVRSYLTSAFTQFLGLTGSAISVDILKVEDKECWIRVPREDLSAVVAAVGGWVGGSDKNGRVGWRVRVSGNWLGSLVAAREQEKIWTG